MMWDIPRVEDLEHLRFLVIRPPQPRDEEREGLLACLSGEERTRFHGMRNRRRARDLLVGRACARLALARFFGISPTDVPLRTSRLGRPMLAYPALAARVSFGISHSGGAVVVGLSVFGRLGIDIQRAPRAPLPLATRFFGPEAATWVAGHPDNERGAAFATMWSVKEAVGKSIGVGPWNIHPIASYPPPAEGAWRDVVWHRFEHSGGAGALALAGVTSAPERGAFVNARTAVPV
jgi:phosphopantetheinyl transferase